MKSNTVLWNGPAGYFENPNFANGTKEILEIIAAKELKIKFMLLLVVEKLLL